MDVPSRLHLPRLLWGRHLVQQEACRRLFVNLSFLFQAGHMQTFSELEKLPNLLVNFTDNLLADFPGGLGLGLRDLGDRHQSRQLLLNFVVMLELFPFLRLGQIDNVFLELLTESDPT